MLYYERIDIPEVLILIRQVDPKNVLFPTTGII